MVEHLYIHVPFCACKCGYCALYSVPSSAAPSGALTAYPLAVAAELDRFTERNGGTLRPRTIYVGGGTPSLLGSALPTLLMALRRRLDLSRLEEWTVESRPEGIDPRVARDLAAHGVNRVSMGVQTFDPAALRAVGRTTPPSAVPRAFETLRVGGIRNVGADLIVGLPGTEPGRIVRDVRELLALDPSHVSIYTLIVEPGTPLAARVAAGEWSVPGDDATMDALAEASRILADAGLHRYEISNYAPPRGRKCRYNLAVWRGEDYLGLGPSASSRVGRERWTNAPDVAAYLDAAKNGAPFFRECETKTPDDDVEERFVFGLRLMEGVDPDDFAERFPAAVPHVPRWKAALDTAVRQGLASRRGTRWRLTPRGREVADSVMEMLC